MNELSKILCKAADSEQNKMSTYKQAKLVEQSSEETIKVQAFRLVEETCSRFFSLSIIDQLKEILSRKGKTIFCIEFHEIKYFF